MAHNMSRNKSVYLKIMTAGDSGDRKLAAQDAMEDTSRLLMYREIYRLSAPYAFHKVFVFPVLGPSLKTFGGFMPIAVRRLSAKQLLQAIKALHDGGVVHRDINSANVLYGFAPFERAAIATKYEYIGRLQKIAILASRRLWKNGQLFMPVTLHDSIVQGNITLVDFGLAVKSGTSVEYKIQSPVIYCAPERIHSADPSFASDMWSYTCIFAEVYLGFPLFYGSSHSKAVSFMVSVLGPLPLFWKSYYQGGGQYDESWYDQSRRPEFTLALEVKVTHAWDDVSLAEQQVVLSILQSGLSSSPEHRFTAGQLLEDAHFKELMAMYGL
ncbi:protein kinase [Trichoderma austrokoningii]